MEYERIHKVQMGVMSPTKLRMKLLGSHGSSKKDEASKSPSRLDADDDADHPKNSLLAQELDEEYPKDRSDSSRSRSDASHGRAARAGIGNGYDSGHDSGNASAGGGNFEFHREERATAVAAAQPHLVTGTFFRQVPSKWNDAEKWIAGRHVVHSNPIFSKKAALHGQNGGGGVRVSPESVAPSPDAKKSGGSSDNASSRSALTQLSSPSPSSVSGPMHKQPRHKKHRGSESPPPSETTVSTSVQSVSTRDVGTEMTPIASQEHSRSGTPAGAATPSLSPLCSVPSSPIGGASASPSASEREIQIRTRREIAALGLQLGKMNIASWASKEDLFRASSPDRSAGRGEDETKKEEFAARAVAWEESQKCKLSSRYQRKEVKIQEWESCQKSKFEANVRQAEVQAEQMKARAKNKLTKRMTILSHKVEGKQARVEARRNRQATRLARQVERIRKTGRVPSRFRFRCCSWFL